MPVELPGQKRRVPLWETAAILLAIASLWPAYVLPAFTQKPAEQVWFYVCYAMLALMALVFIRRMVLFRRLMREQEATRRQAEEQGRGDGPRARLPWEQ